MVLKLLHIMTIKGQATNQWVYPKVLSVILLCIVVASTEGESTEIWMPFSTFCTSYNIMHSNILVQSFE